MEKLVVIGGNPLVGEIRASGAKNSSLPILAASILTDSTVEIEGVPNLTDVSMLKWLLTYLGAQVTTAGRKVVIDSRNVRSLDVGEDIMRKMRASNLILGPLLARFGFARMSYPGGCAIGDRPMDLHLKGLKALGATITERSGYIQAKANGLVGAEIHLDFPSVGATENIIMAAVLADGETAIRNAAKEPEIVDLQNFLNRMGAQVKGAGTDLIKVTGVKALGGCHHVVIPDRIEVGTHLIAGAITGGDLTVINCIPEHVEPVIAKLKEANVKVNVFDDAIQVFGPKDLRAVDIKTLPYPGFPTDMQSQMMALMAVSQGTSVISESIFENRFKQVDELRRMGASIRLEGRTCIITGVPQLSGAFVCAPDLRAGAALVLAGLAAEEATIIEGVEHIDRGYESIEDKYRSVGAKIMRVAR